jgi:hypothetical protein
MMSEFAILALMTAPIAKSRTSVRQFNHQCRTARPVHVGVLSPVAHAKRKVAV